MKDNILVVEDEFIVANDLRLKLKKAGYQVCGIAPSVEEAKKMIDEHKPTWVLLDIFLQDGSMGTDLAPLLTEKNIGFIYISANTNQSVLEAAKATQPYAFLVKPFREKDLLIMLDIARQKHQNNLDLLIQRELMWKRQLENIAESQIEQKSKTAQIPGAFQTFIPFDLMRVTYKNRRENGFDGFNFVRTGFDEYQIFTHQELDTAISFKSSESGRPRSPGSAPAADFYLNGIDFKRSLMDDIWEKRASTFFRAESKLSNQIRLDDAGPVTISFYSKKPDSYSETLLQLLLKTEKTIGRLLEQLHPQARTAVAASRIKEVPAPVKQTAAVTSSALKFDGIVGKSPALVRVLDRIAMVAVSATSVLITGESGTGKERVAQCIHKLSPRKDKPITIVNCGALPVDLIESELFGHEKGAFTGAFDKRIGKFEQANGSTIFLDEIGELPLAAQVKLLRVLQEMEFERVGSSTTTKVDVRVITATNRNLEKEVAQGRFRLDLYYRLNVFPIELPPLRERQDDIVLLAQSFIEKFTKKLGRTPLSISSEALRQLTGYQWPGNIRELEHAVERTILSTSGDTITSILLPNSQLNALTASQEPNAEYKLKTLDENEAEHIIEVLRRCQGRVAGPGGAAEILGLPASTLHSRMKKLGIRKEFDSNR